MIKNRMIPDTDLNVSPVGLGTANAGLAWDGADACRIFDAYLDMGGNLIDTAHVYSDWIAPERARSERVVGDWLKKSGKRNRIVLVTKGGHPDMTVEHPDTHASRMTKADMEADLEGSLRQLRTDCIDLYFYHRDDTNQSVEELIEVMEGFRRAGKIRYYGCSNWTLERIMEADRYCQKMGYRGFAANQVLYNVGCRSMKPMEDDTLVCADAPMLDYHRSRPENLLMPYMGVCSGFFHKYLAKGDEAVKNSPYYTPENLRMAERIRELCRKYDATVTQAVLGFFGQQDFACLPLYGTRNEEQIVEAMKAFEIPFEPGDYEP